MVVATNSIKLQDIPFFNQKTVECDLTAFVRQLNDLVERVNYNHQYLVELYETVEDLKQRVGCLEKKVEDHENRITELERRMDGVEGNISDLGNKITNIENSIRNMGNQINNIASTLAWYDGKLPAEKDWIDGKGFNLAFGNINVLSANSGTPTIDIGVITSKNIENNDIYFN